MNSTVGVGGLFDVARGEGVTPKDDEDTGQTLAVYGVKPGPYLVLPFFPPSTVRDTVGSAVDGLLDPLSYVLPFVGSVAKRGGTTVNDRSINLQVYEDVEEGVIDLYSGVRNIYLQRRERAIRESCRTPCRGSAFAEPWQPLVTLNAR
jgi:phospholipid-binding lipoprotein MlaA